MGYIIKCSSIDEVSCPHCCAKNIVSIGKPTSHCGSCGTNVTVKFVERKEKVENVQEELIGFSQLSLFGD